MQSSSEDRACETEEAMYLKLMPVLTTLLYANTSSETKLMELHSNIANLLTRCVRPNNIITTVFFLNFNMNVFVIFQHSTNFLSLSNTRAEYRRSV